jgi:putative transposase
MRVISHIWVHLVIETSARKQLFTTELAKPVEEFIRSYSQGLKILLQAIYVNADHIHLLINLPDDLSIDDYVGLVKKESGEFINSQLLVNSEFAWESGYTALTVSDCDVKGLSAFINNQEEYHKVISYSEEFKLMRTNKFIPLEQADTSGQLPS